jgi:predicted GNAT superfamily acetyltransferase
MERAGARAMRIAVPREYPELRAADPRRADRWRDAIADAFDGCLRAGLTGLAFDRERSAYVFGKADAA